MKNDEITISSIKEVRRDDKYGFVTESGREVIPCRYDSVGEFDEDFLYVCCDGKLGLFDQSGREIVPCVYSAMDFISGFAEGLLGVEKVEGDKELWGFIDKNGQEVIACRYEDVFRFSDGLARVRRDNKFGFIDKTGKEVVSCEYYEAGPFSEGLAWVANDGMFGFIDKKGEVVIPLKYYRAYSFEGGMARVIVDNPEVVENWKHHYIDKTGKEVDAQSSDSHTKAFKYLLLDGDALSKSQEEFLAYIENLPFPFGGISKLKDLRTSIKVRVNVFGHQFLLECWEKYKAEYKELHSEFYQGKHAKECHRHQGEIGYRRDFADEQIRRMKEPREDFRPILGLYNRTYKWWEGKYAPQIALVSDHIKDYASRACVNEDVVFGFVFIQEMMHAYFDSLNAKGYPSIEPLEESFSEFGMLAFIDSIPDLREVLFPYAWDYVTSKKGKEPRGFGYGIELFARAGDDAAKMINRYRYISNWTDIFDYKYLSSNNHYYDSLRKYESDPSEENASEVYRDIIGLLNIDWEEPFAPIQPAIGEQGDFVK